MPNAIQTDIYSKALGRDASLTDKFFTSDGPTDFGLSSNSTLPANSDGTFGIKASDYVGGTTDTSWSDTAFDSNNIGSTLGGIGSAIKGVAGIYDSYNKKQYQDKIFGMEEARVNREVAKQKKAQEGLEAAWS